MSDRCMRKRPFINIHLDMWQSLLDVILARPVVQYSNTLHNTLPATSCHTRWPLSNLFAQILVFNTRYFHPHICGYIFEDISSNWVHLRRMHSVTISFIDGWFHLNNFTNRHATFLFATFHTSAESSFWSVICIRSLCVEVTFHSCNFWF